MTVIECFFNVMLLLQFCLRLITLQLMSFPIKFLHYIPAGCPPIPHTYHCFKYSYKYRLIDKLYLRMTNFNLNSLIGKFFSASDQDFGHGCKRGDKIFDYTCSEH